MDENSVTIQLYRQSAAIPYRQVKSGIQVLLITTLKKKKWIVPKGLVESGMSGAESALKEAQEEAGVSGKITTGCVGTFSYKKWNGICKVDAFLLEVDEEFENWEEQAFRERRWFDIKDAAEQVHYDEIRKIIEEIPMILQSLE